MKRYLLLSRLVATAWLLTAPLSAYAEGGEDISAMFIGVINALFGSPALWIAVATLAAIIAGLTLMLSSDEGALQKARSTLGAIAIGAVLVTIITLTNPAAFVGKFYNPIAGTTIVLNDVVGLEAIGFADWIASIAVIAGIVMIIVAALRAVLSFGDEGEYQKVRASVLHMIAGIILIAGAITIKNVFFDTQTPEALLGLVLSPLKILIGVIALIAIGIIVYAGFRMIISFGKEDEFSNARSLIIRAITGLVVLLVSFTIINVVLSCFDGTCVT